MLTVAISVDSPTDYGPDAVHIIAAACEEVIGAQRCPVASEIEPGMVAAWYAGVHPTDRRLTTVRIEFRDRTADGVLIEERLLTFSERDPQRSRLESVGSVIAALAAAREGAPLPTRPRTTRGMSSASSTRPARPAESARPDWSVDLAALVVPAFADHPYRLGGSLRAQLGFYERPFGLIAVRYVMHPGNPAFRWLTLSGGVGARLLEREAPFNLEFNSQIVMEHATISAERGGEEESGSHVGFGGQLGICAVWASSHHWSLIFGVDGTLVLPRLHVVVAEQEVARTPLASLGLSLGLRLQP